MNEQRKLSEYDVADRDQFIKDANAALTELGKLFGLRFGKLDIPDFSCFGGSFVAPRLDEAFFRKELQKRKTSLLNEISEFLIKKVPDLKVGDSILIGGPYYIAFNLLCDFFKLSHDELARISNQLCTEYTGITFEDVLENLANLYKAKFMRYRFWDKKAYYAIERFFFIGDSINCPDVAYFKDYQDEGIETFEEFLEIFESVAQDEYLSDDKKLIISSHYIDTYFAEYLPIKFMDKNKLNDFYNWFKKMNG